MLLEAAAAGAALCAAVAALPEAAPGQASGLPASTSQLCWTLTSLARSMSCATRLARGCGQTAAASAAETVLGRVLRLLAVSGRQEG